MCLIATLAVGTLLFSQDIRTAILVGTVTDSSGAVVPNVAVTVTNVDTGVVTRSRTKGEGSYYLPFLNVGNYRLTMEAPGFKKYEQSGLILNAGENPRVDVTLEVGATGETIKVTVSAPLLVTDSAVIGSIANAKDIHETFRFRNPNRSISCTTRRARRRTTTAPTISRASLSRR